MRRPSDLKSRPGSPAHSDAKSMLVENSVEKNVIPNSKSSSRLLSR